MKLFNKLAMVAMVAISLTACGRAAPDAGEEAVLIQKPWFFGHGGVVDEPVQPGLTFTSWTTSPVYVNMNPQALDIRYDDMMSGDGIPLDFHATATLQVVDPVELVRHFSGGSGDIQGDPAWYVHNILPVENNYVRDAFKQHKMHELAIENTGANQVEADVMKRLEAYITEHRIPVRVINFTLGKIDPPKEIKSQRTATAEEQQRQQTELQTKIAEDNRKAAETSRAEADDAYRQTMGLSPEQFVELQRVNMLSKVCAQSHCTMIVGNGTALVNAK